jgi:hypothetical protein
VTASAEELDGYAPGASALILSGEDGQVQTRELVHHEDPTQGAWYVWIVAEGDVVRVLCPIRAVADDRRELGHELCNDYNTLARWPTLYCLPWGDDYTAVLAVRIPRRPEEMRELTMLEILEAIDRILVDAPIAYRELAAAASVD